MSTVSVITPSHNSAQFISETIRSVLNQSFSDWELIVVDDCSTDNSVEVIQSFVDQDSRIKLIQLSENSGAAVARNTAIEAAAGRFIAFLDSDDKWLPHKLETQIQFMEDNDVAFSYAAYEKINEKGEVFGLMGVPEKVSYKQLLKTCVIGCLTAVYDTEKLGKVYMPTSTKREDFATWLNILKQIDFAHGLTVPLAQYRVYANQTSGKKVSMAKENWRLYRDLEKLNFFQASYYFGHYAVRGVLRTKFPKLAKLLGVLD